MIAEQAPIIERGLQYENDPDLVKGVIAEGCEKAQDAARATLEEVREAMGISWRS